jgi:hypothetical protein
MIDVIEIKKATQLAIQKQNEQFVSDYEKENVELIEKINEEITKSANLGLHECDVKTNANLYNCNEINNPLIKYLNLKGLNARAYIYTTIIIWWYTVKTCEEDSSSDDDDDDVKPCEGLSFNEESAYYNSNETSIERSERLGHDCMYTK